MAKGRKQKLKMLYLKEIFERYTDEEHPVTLQEVTKKLAEEEVSVERKTFYDDIRILRDDYGMDLIKCDDNYHYYLGGREFELAELKLLVDAMLSAKFISAKQKKTIIEKLGSLTSEHYADQLRRQMVTDDRSGAFNKKFFYTVDEIHKAIAGGSKITFRYWQWNEKGKKLFRRNGESYLVSPYGLVWDNHNYYLVGLFENEEEGIRELRTYRVDKMEDTEAQEEKIDLKTKKELYHPEVYKNMVFEMYHGEKERVHLRCNNELANVIIDRFNVANDLRPSKVPGCFEVHVLVENSPLFRSWIASLNSDPRNTAIILGPASVVEEQQRDIRRMAELYGIE